MPGHTDRAWWEALKPNVKVTRAIGDREITFFIERVRPGFLYACTVDDVCRMLSLIPAKDWEGLSTFVFRQPTAKQALLKPSWGRIDYYAGLFEPGRVIRKYTPVIFLDAVNPSRTLKWNKSVAPDDAKELERLRSDGHEISYLPKSISIRGSFQAVRNTQLYRTLLHEIGHWVDKVENADRPSEASDADYGELLDRYWARPEGEREAFAHRYADTSRSRLQRQEAIPFDPILDEEFLNREKIPVGIELDK